VQWSSGGFPRLGRNHSSRSRTETSPACCSTASQNTPGSSSTISLAALNIHAANSACRPINTTPRRSCPRNRDHPPPPRTVRLTPLLRTPNRSPANGTQIYNLALLPPRASTLPWIMLSDGTKRRSLRGKHEFCRRTLLPSNLSASPFQRECHSLVTNAQNAARPSLLNFSSSRCPPADLTAPQAAL